MIIENLSSNYKFILDSMIKAKTLRDFTRDLYKGFKVNMGINRLAFARIKDSDIIAEVAFSDSNEIFLDSKFRQNIYEGSLIDVIKNGKPRIINDLEEYMKVHPYSISAALILKERMMSSLTFPIFINDEAVGFLFLNSFKKNFFKFEDVEALLTVQKVIELAYQKTSIVQDLIDGMLIGIAKTVELKDNETGNHLIRMASYSKEIAKTLVNDSQYKIDQVYVENILDQAPLHDIGKAGIPDRILLKPGKLDLDEFEIMKTHTTLGYGIIKNIIDVSKNFEGFLDIGSEIALYHHEKWDGSGYPQGLKGDQIPLSARIVAIADVFDALTSKRPYKEAFGFDESFKMIIDDAGSHFDPALVEKFANIKQKIRMIYDQYREVSTIEGATNAHLIWMKKFDISVSTGKVEPNLNEIPCGFSIFYKSIKNMPKEFEDEWKYIGDLHETIHKMANKAFTAIQNDKMNLALQIYEETKKKSDEMLRLVSELSQKSAFKKENSLR